ncbi:MAG: adenylate/guanylate cyclase domain-containing protein [Lysobacterales bacterium]
MKRDRQQSRRDVARLEILRQELLAPLLSVEGHLELLKEHLGDKNCVADLEKIEQAAGQTRELVDAMLAAETEQVDTAEQERIRSRYRHDLRNSVGAIAGYSEIILEDLEDSGQLSDEARSYIENQLADASKLLLIVDTLFKGEQGFDQGSEAALNVDIHSVFDSFERSEEERNDSLSGHILVVDDNDSSRNLLTHQLSRQAHTTSSAASGRQALETIRRSAPDLILLDLFMPDMNGFDVLREMHKDKALRTIPVIIITGLSDREAAARCIEAGAFDILTKPVSPNLLWARVNACLERKAWHDKELAYQRQLEKSYAFIRKVFGRYLSDEVVEQILESDDGMQMGGGKREVTIMMTDIRGFSMLSQQLDPQDCVKMLNNYFGVMTPLIQKYNGVIDEFLGDAILAIFGAPVANDRHAEHAVACALEMQQAMHEVNLNNQRWGLPDIEMGIALNTGEVVVGNIGSESRSKYGVVGHHVNLTARIESFTVGGQVMASEYTVKALQPEIDTPRSLEIEAKGISGRLMIHEIGAIGDPYHLRLDTAEVEAKPLRAALPVTFNRLSGKAIADEQVDGQLVAAAGRIAHLATRATLEAMSNLRMRVSGYPGAESDQIFSKVTAVIEEPARTNGENRYIIRFTSASPAAREHILSMVAAE